MSFLRSAVAASLLLLSTVTVGFAAPAPNPGDDSRERRPHPPMSVERLAMENIMVEKLSQQTGRPATEIAALMNRPPPEVAKELGLDDAAMRSNFDSARLTLIQRATEAQLITAAQAEQLRNAPRPMRHGPRSGEPPQGEPPAPGGS